MELNEFINQFEAEQANYYINITNAKSDTPTVNVCRKFNGNSKVVWFDLDLKNGIIYRPQAYCSFDKYLSILGTVSEILERGY